MRQYPIPFNEDARVFAVQNVPGLTRDNEVLFDAICTAAARMLDCPISHISVVEESTQWYKSVIGIELEEMPKVNSFCTHTIMSAAPLVVPDLSKDEKFRNHPMVAEGGPQARYYAGVPLVLSSGFRFGSLCVLDFVPHVPPTEREMAALTELGRAVVAALEKAPAAPAAEVHPSCQETFLALVGHELRTPLTIADGTLQLLGMRSSDPADRKLIRSTANAIHHLSNLIASVLKFSDIRTGELQLDEEETDLRQVLELLQADHEALFSDRGKTVMPPLVEIGAPILADRKHLEICLTSLLLNSALHGGQVIGLHAGQTAEGHVEITVLDDGRLDECLDLAELYKPFIVGGDILNRGTGGGLGLGLPLTRRLVELHGGEFEVLADGTGTAACIRLPNWRLQG